MARYAGLLGLLLLASQSNICQVYNTSIDGKDNLILGATKNCENIGHCVRSV